jgi:pyrimidine-specific ribonucleoside hydrolase
MKVLPRLVLLFVLIAAWKHSQQQVGGDKMKSGKRIPVINITDLYHPFQDPGDNFDLIMGFALPELELKAIVLDITDAFRKPLADHPTLWKDPRGPREAGFVPVLQLNYIFNRNVPVALGPLTAMTSEQDQMTSLPAFQNEGIELFLSALRKSAEPVDVLSFGSARVLAVAFNREPNLLRRKIRMIHLSAGTASPQFKLGKDEGANAIPGGEWNVALDVHAFNRVLKSGLPVALYPCATEDGAFALGTNNSYWQLPDLSFVNNMDRKLRRYLEFALGKLNRIDFLRAMEFNEPLVSDTVFPKPHHVWETALWMHLSRRKLIQRANGSFEIVKAGDIRKDDRVLKDELRSCRITTRNDGRFTYTFTSERTNTWLYHREDYKENERALRAALPNLYLSLRSP